MQTQPPFPKYGRLKILSLELLPAGRWRRTFAHCVCSCGNKKTVLLKELKNGHTGSCGCLHREMMSANFTKHGMSHSRAWGVWKAMVYRCSNPKDTGYKNYGGRGIRVCDEWRRSFIAFWSFAQTLLPPGSLDIPNGLSIDRIDNDGHYEPGNIRFATRSQQQRNFRGNRLLAFRGETRCMVEWAEVLGIDREVIRGRLDRGWPVADALTTPVRPFLGGTNLRIDLAARIDAPANPPEESRDEPAFMVPPGTAEKNGRRFRHGHAGRDVNGKKSVEYSTWQGIKQRCYDSNTPGFTDYGARGIKVCDRWLGADGFAHFLADMGPRPGKGYSLDRIDSTGDYGPANCRWATCYEQMNNRRCCRRITFQGRTHTIAQWGRILGIGDNAIRNRLKAGWSLEKTMTTPLIPRRIRPA